MRRSRRALQIFESFCCDSPPQNLYQIMAQVGQADFNRNINHLAFAVPDCDRAVEWYGSILGFRLITRINVDREENPADAVFDIYPEELQKAKIAVMASGNGVGVEFFEFLEPKIRQAAAFDITRGGVFHVAVTDPHPEELCSKIVAAGGKKIGKAISPFPPTVDGFKDRALYMQDPWGNTIEIITCSLEMLLANRL